MALAGVSTIGVTLSYGIESGEAGKKPTEFKGLTRINNIGGIALSIETIDASALEDYVERTIAGRASTGGEWSVTVNITDDTIKEWSDLISASDTAKKSGFSTWFQVTSPYLAKSFYVVAEPPKNIPMSEMGQNELQTVEMTLAINEYKGMDDKVEVTP